MMIFADTLLQTTHPSMVAKYMEYKRDQSSSRIRGHSTNLSEAPGCKKPRSNTTKQAQQLTLMGHSHDVHAQQPHVTQSKVNNLVVNYIVNEYLPLRTVEKPNFKELVTGLAPSASVMARVTLTKRVNERSVRILSSIREQIQSAISVCTTADIWSCMKKSYMGVTGHWINEDLKRISVALACRRFKGSHTADAIAEKLSTIHADFGLDHRKIIFTVTDNGSNLVKAFTEFQEEAVVEGVEMDQSNHSDEECDEESDNDLEDEVSVETTNIHVILQESDSTSKFYLPKHIRCGSHTFNLLGTTDVHNIVKNSSGTYKSLYRSTMAKCSKLWTNVSRSTKSSDLVESIVKVSLRTPGATRWNSTYDALNRLLEPRVKDKLPQIMDVLKISRFNPIEIEILEEYVQVMGPVATALDKLQGEEHCYLGLLMPTVQQVHRKLLEMMSKVTHSKPLVKGLVESINRRFSYLFEYNRSSLIYAVSAVAHPNFKLRWVPADKKEWVKEAFIAETKKYAANSTPSRLPEQNSTPRESMEADTFFDFEDDASELESRSRESDVTIECLRYLEDGYSPSIDVLQRYPNVRTLFRMLNCTVASSAPVERLFSKGALIAIPRRNRLGDKRFEQLLLIQANKHMLND